ncbi:MAG: adenylate/guanylate cyclase domain-containing protein [Chloroflexota bacterium]
MDRKAKILIVDDEEVMRDVLEGLLFYQGYDLAFAGNGRVALDKVAEVQPDLILLDVMMPGINGFEVCRQLKAAERWRHIPIILITALSGKDDLATGLDAGADDFVHKPFSNLELLARVRSMLRVKRQYDAFQEQQKKLADALQLNEKFGRALAQHLAELELLHDTGLRLMNNLDLDSVLSLVAQAAFEIVPEASGCVIHFLLDESQLLPVVFSPESKGKTVYPSVGSEDIARRAITAKDVVYIPDASIVLGEAPALLEKMRTLLAAPLLDHQQVLGAITVYSPEPDSFENSHPHILSILAHQAAVAIAKAQHIEQQSRAKEREKWAIRDLFQRYVSPAVVDRLVNGVEDLALGGKRQDVTVLFADIRGFTSFSENQPPERLIEVLNQYLGLAVEAILAHEGTLDKFMGDAVMAMFNAPLPQPDHTRRAVGAALAMQQTMAEYNFTAAGHNHLTFGIGIHTGQAVVGNIGTAQQMNYTTIGDTINLAKRLQEHAAGGEIILSQAAYEAIKEQVTVEALGPLSIKGRSTSEQAYKLLTCRTESQATIAKELKP